MNFLGKRKIREMIWIRDHAARTGENAAKGGILFIALDGIDVGTGSLAMTAEILVGDGVDLLLDGWDEVEVDGKYGAGAEEGD